MILRKSVVMRLILRALMITSALAILATRARADAEIVIAIRYLQAEGTSHSHLFLYREDGKLLRQLTNDNSGQDSAPIFAPDGASIIFTREKPGGAREFWSVDPLGKALKKLGLPRIGMALLKARPISQTSSPRNRHLPTLQLHLRNLHRPPQRRYPRTNHRMVLSN
jgi:hypothetical protein